MCMHTHTLLCSEVAYVVRSVWPGWGTILDLVSILLSLDRHLDLHAQRPCAPDRLLATQAGDYLINREVNRSS